jgi:hypothetical protein
MLTNTGKGQRKALETQFKANLLGTAKDGKTDNPEESPFRSGYSPLYQAGGSRGFLVSGAKPNLYAFNDSPSGDASGAKSGIVKNFLNPATKEEPINDMNWNREKLVVDAGFVGLPSASDSKPFAQNFAWTSNKGATTNLVGQELQQLETLGPALPINAPQIIGDKKSLLNKTQMLFNSKGMRTMVSAHGSADGDNNKDQIQTAVSYNGFISKGSGVLSRFKFNPDGTLGNKTTNDSAESTFCRTWIPQNRYDTVSKLIRSRGLNQKELTGGQILTGGTRGWRLHNSERMSVLDDNGFVKIAPYKTDNLTRQSTIPKKYMFSIENLAWVGSPAVNLLPIEQGPGDLLTGKFGRIMWFPPYDLTFSESSSVSLESNLFIGRGEPLYTYNNTERTGNLSFKIVVDHPSAMNAFKGNKGPSDEYIRSWFAGCVEDDYYTGLLTQEEKEKVKQTTKTVFDETTIPAVEPPTEITIYFPNDITSVDYVIEKGYEDGINEGEFPGIGPYNGEKQYKSATDKVGYDSPLSTYETKATNPPPIIVDGEVIGYFDSYVGVWPDTTDYGFNKPGTSKSLGNKKLKVPTNKEFDTWNDEAYKTALRDYLKNTCPSCVAEIEGYASSQGGGQTYANEQLSINRAAAMKKWLLDNNIIEDKRIVGAAKTGIKDGQKFPYTKDTPVDSEGPKYARYGRIKFTNNAQATKTKKPRTVTESQQISLNSQVRNRYYTEQDFFEKLKREDSFVFDKIRQQIRYFHPAFHSTTPEGLNSRLTFLLQCTRQGPTTNTNQNPENLSFGPAPVCILRIGDFYNTKIMMDNLNIDYEPLVWDLNPEGVGVQPMIANVTISFKYIGGSSLYGPINKLQNALSFNYFANSQVYDPRADYIATIESIQKEGLIKNFPTDPKLRTRKTFGSTTLENNPTANDETAYGLIPGLDSVTDSMGALENKVPTYAPPTVDQTATSDEDKQQTGPDIQASDGASSSCLKDKDNLYWINEKDEKLKPVRVTSDYIVTIFFDFNNPAVQISQPYNYQINITDSNNTNNVYTITNNTILFSGDNKTSLHGVEIDLYESKYIPKDYPPKSLIDIGNYTISFKLIGVTDPTCEIIFNTATEVITKTDTKCDTDGHIIIIGKTASDTSNTALPVSKDTKGNFISFYVNSTDKTIDLTQDYKLTVTLISGINENDRYVWNTTLDVPKTFPVNSLVNTLYFSETTPKTPELIEGNELPYKMEFKLVGVTEQCSYEIGVPALTNNAQANEYALSKLVVNGVITTPVNISFNIYNQDPTKNIINGQYKVKSTIKSSDGTEQYMYINKTDGGSEDFIYDINAGINTNLSFYLKDTTPVCTGFTTGKQYVLETTLTNETTNVQLNKVALTNATNTTANQAGGLTITGFEKIRITSGSVTNKILKVKLSQENIYDSQVLYKIISDDEYKTFVDKGINIKIQAKDAISGTYLLDKNLSYSDNIDDNSTKDIFQVGTFIGDIPGSPFPFIGIPNGVYNFSVYYENNLIETIELNVDGREEIEYNKNSAVTPAPAPPTPVATNSNNDSEVVSQIEIFKVYKYDTQTEKIVVDFNWGKTQDFPVFALQSSSSYKGQASVKYKKQDGTNAVLDFGVSGKFFVRRNDDFSVIFGSGSDSSNDVILGNTEDDTTVPGGKSWEIRKKWSCDIDFDDPEQEYIDEILIAQRTPGSSFKIIWDNGTTNNYTFYLDNTPLPPATTPAVQLPITYTDKYVTNDCDSAHSFGRQAGQTSGKSLTAKVGEIMDKIYNAGFNPKITSLEVVISRAGSQYTTEYTVVL